MLPAVSLSVSLQIVGGGDLFGPDITKLAGDGEEGLVGQYRVVGGVFGRERASPKTPGFGGMESTCPTS